MPPEPPRHISPLIQPWFGLSRGDEGQDARHVRVGAGGAGAGRSRQQRAPTRLELTALGADDTVVFEGRFCRPDRRRSSDGRRGRRRAPCSTCRPAACVCG